MLTIDVHGLDVARARLFDREARIVGWGTGSVFDYFHDLFPVRLDYLIDNDVSRRGRAASRIRDRQAGTLDLGRSVADVRDHLLVGVAGDSRADSQHRPVSRSPRQRDLR